jgi:uncharacterized pyridoxamine 5'-phosphate oxidase family protein
MSKAYDYLKEFGVFYVASNNGGVPAVRPFGAVMEQDGVLYLVTGNFKDVYKQLKQDPQVQLAATKAGTLTWLRISGKAEECNEVAMKQAMLDACPSLVNIFKSADNPVMTLFAIKEMQAELHKDDGSVEKL